MVIKPRDETTTTTTLAGAAICGPARQASIRSSNGSRGRSLERTVELETRVPFCITKAHGRPDGMAPGTPACGRGPVVPAGPGRRRGFVLLDGFVLLRASDSTFAASPSSELRSLSKQSSCAGKGKPSCAFLQVLVAANSDASWPLLAWGSIWQCRLFG